MRVLITGNMGYVGSVLVPYLKNNSNYELVGLDSGIFSSCLISDVNILPESSINYQIYKDVRDVNDDDLKNIDVIVHLAAISNDPMGNLFEDVTEKINLHASKRLIDIAVKAKIKKIVFASSCSMYGDSGDELRNENSNLNPLTVYAKSKVKVEEYAKEIIKKGVNLNFVAMRFATACGPSDRFRNDLVLNDFISSALHKKSINIQSDGSPWRPLIDTRDMSKALMWAINYKNEIIKGNFDAFNIGLEDWNYSVIHLAEKVAKHLGGVSININPKGRGDPRSYKVDFSHFRKCSNGILGKRSLEETIDSVIEKIANIDYIKIEKYYRLNTLQNLVREKILDSNLRII